MTDTQKGERGGWILIVEDDTDSSEVLTEILIGEGYQVIRAETAQEARAKLFRQKFRAVLLDLKLGQQSGEQVVSYMRTLTGVNDRTPVLVVSGNVDSPSLQRLRPLVQGFLIKPFAAPLFLERLNAAMNVPVAPKKKA